MTPFLSAPVAHQLIAEAALSRARRFSLLTWLTDASTGSGFLDPLAIRSLLRADWEVRSLKRLHAKVIVVDGRFGLVGSGNFTTAGMQGGNVELGVVLSSSQRRHARATVDAWWRSALLVTEPILEPYIRRAKQRAARGAGHEFGGVYPVPVPTRIHAQSRGSTERWLKMMYATGARETVGYWAGLTWISDRHTVGADGSPKRKPSYRPGDTLVCYITPWRRCPAIVEVLDSSRFDPEFVASRGAPGDDERWSWVTPVRSIAATHPRTAPTLSDIGVASSSVRQQGHIRLTPQQYRRAAGLIPALQ